MNGCKTTKLRISLRQQSMNFRLADKFFEVNFRSMFTLCKFMIKGLKRNTESMKM